MPSIIFSDSELTNALKMGGENAFELIYDRYWNRLYRITVSKIKGSENAKEIVQDIFLDLWARRENVQIEVLEHYLLRTLKYKIIDFYKKETVRKNHAEFVFTHMSEADWDTEEELTYNDLNQMIMNCIDQLPPRTKTIIELNRMQHKSIDEIAKILNVTTRTVDNHLSQGLKTLRLQLKEYDLYIFLLLSYIFDL